MNRLDFLNACEKVTSTGQSQNGIGTLKEKSLHAVLKNYFEPHESNHEIKLGGYVADILGENGIIEIQTGNFDKLRKKLIAFLEVTEVTVAYPIASTKWIYWIDENTGEISEKRKSPKKGKAFDAVYELYKIKDLLLNPNLHLVLVLLDLEEYRMLDGWSRDKKKGSSKLDKMPIDIVDEVHINSLCDYEKLVPFGLPKQFTSKELLKLTKTSPRVNQCGIGVLRELGIIKQVGKKGRAFLYEMTKQDL